ncbi:UDP-2,3-diacylglucosamine diphosphatase [candidate division KSB1 bacterium]|nr:UDP-2,3-diacylglucosamine diphosphatase [candidate division KSB1 bacterium]
MQRRNLFELLERAEAEAKSLFVVGDLFDFWYEWATVIPKQHFALLHRFRALVERGIAIHQLSGNHDFRLHGFLETEVGLTTHLDGVHARIHEQSVFIFHGDGILQRDTGYRFVKRVLRSPVSQRVFSWIHPDLGMRLARGTSMTSRKVIKENPHDDVEFLAFAQERFRDGYDGVIMGHTHRPVEHREGQRTYVNLGDWIQHYSYAVHDGTELKLHRLHEDRARP